MSEPRPDSVRLALPREAPELAALQRRVWAAELGERADAVLGQLDLDTMTEAWQLSITRPPLASYRVLVAVAANDGQEPDRVVGMATTMPSDDPDATQGVDGLVGEFLIDPLARGRGHGSRLLNACVDTLRADGFGLATWWVNSTDDDLRGFLTGAGWAADGSHREIGTEDESVRIKQVRLHSDISGGPADAAETGSPAAD
ncbi:GNAT family N-acetyltransferase [Enemella evansiae]|uniref:GNAT family N-acetyltransferase n=1 Tax=Enemella evansiae TaxID=2016499 RepID=UPI000B9639D3|nr:GNAT family N-acetyltransferase [Enemella evansiae]OYN93541.1 GNAT family N-acetyltransferase [Enemella evansiae]OYO05794.1 GNAT family N-acetyltransferase [Enemella evansiae]OYO15059.1 GNAT family N-acetyltransferase [Enemella evansiae]OYO20129.1 GNAT family N-acetyltransferase [Enemella evansiae]TDO92598.1 acetyltransferase (GNAT) family protein [Enemella evansiae]